MWKFNFDQPTLSWADVSPGDNPETVFEAMINDDSKVIINIQNGIIELAAPNTLLDHITLGKYRIRNTRGWDDKVRLTKLYAEGLLDAFQVRI